MDIKNQIKTFLPNRKLEILIFSFFLLINFATTGGHEYSFDDLLYLMHTENIALNYSLFIHPYETPSAWNGIFGQNDPEMALKSIQERYLTYQEIDYDEDTQLEAFGTPSSMLLPFVTVPLYYLALIVNERPVTFLGFFSNTIILSMVSLIIYKTGTRIFESNKLGFILAVIFMTGTWIWAYNTGMMLRPLASLMIILGFYFIITKKDDKYLRVILAAICFGLTLIATSSSIILIPGLFLFGIVKTMNNKKQVLLFVLTFIAILSIQGVINEIRFNSFYDFGFGPFQNTNFHSGTEGLYGYFVSLSWGIPIHFPLFAFFIGGMYVMWRKTKSMAILFSYSFIATWLFVGTLPSPSLWEGAPGWGPRYFSTILPFIIIGIGFALQEFCKKWYMKIVFILLAGFGFFMALMGKLVWSVYGFYNQGEEEMKSNLLQNRWFEHNYNFEYSTLNFHLQVLSDNTLVKYINGSVGGLAPCNYDLYVLCRIGEIPFILLLCLCGVFAFFIIKEVKRNNTKIAN